MAIPRRLHDKHWQLFALLGLVRCPLPTTLIQERLFATDKTHRYCWRFLRDTAELGAIERLSVPLVTAAVMRGRPPSAWRLTREGAALYTAHTGCCLPLPSRRARSPLLYRHQLGEAQTMLAWNDACE